MVELLYFAAKGLKLSFKIYRMNIGYYLVFDMSQTVSIKYGQRTADYGLRTGYKIRTIKYGLVKCMVNKGTSSPS